MESIPDIDSSASTVPMRAGEATPSSQFPGVPADRTPWTSVSGGAGSGTTVFHTAHGDEQPYLGPRAAPEAPRPRAVPLRAWDAGATRPRSGLSRPRSLSAGLEGSRRRGAAWPGDEAPMPAAGAGHGGTAPASAVPAPRAHAADPTATDTRYGPGYVPFSDVPPTQPGSVPGGFPALHTVPIPRLRSWERRDIDAFVIQEQGMRLRLNAQGQPMPSMRLLLERKLFWSAPHFVRVTLGVDLPTESDIQRDPTLAQHWDALVREAMRVSYAAAPAPVTYDVERALGLLQRSLRWNVSSTFGLSYAMFRGELDSAFVTHNLAHSFNTTANMRQLILLLARKMYPIPFREIILSLVRHDDPKTLDAFFALLEGQKAAYEAFVAVSARRSGGGDQPTERAPQQGRYREPARDLARRVAPVRHGPRERTCYNCGQAGHIARDCRASSSRARSPSPAPLAGAGGPWARPREGGAWGGPRPGAPFPPPPPPLPSDRQQVRFAEPLATEVRMHLGNRQPHGRGGGARPPSSRGGMGQRLNRGQRSSGSRSTSPARARGRALRVRRARRPQPEPVHQLPVQSSVPVPPAPTPEPVAPFGFEDVEDTWGPLEGVVPLVYGNRTFTFPSQDAEHPPDVMLVVGNPEWAHYEAIWDTGCTASYVSSATAARIRDTQAGYLELGYGAYAVRVACEPFIVQGVGEAPFTVTESLVLSSHLHYRGPHSEYVPFLWLYVLDDMTEQRILLGRDAIAACGWAVVALAADLSGPTHDERIFHPTFLAARAELRDQHFSDTSCPPAGAPPYYYYTSYLGCPTWEEYEQEQCDIEEILAASPLHPPSFEEVPFAGDMYVAHPTPCEYPCEDWGVDDDDIYSDLETFECPPLLPQSVLRVAPLRVNSSLVETKEEETTPTPRLSHAEEITSRAEALVASGVVPLEYTPGPDVHDDGIDLNEIDVGVLHDPAEVRSALTSVLDNAKTQGLAPEHVARLRHALLDTTLFDLFRLQFGGDPPARVTPVSETFLPSIEDVRPYSRSYSNEDSEYLRIVIAELQACGMIFHNPTASVASNAYPVNKPVPPTTPLRARKRLVLDLRNVNAHVQPIPYPTPRLDAFTSRIAGHTAFATVDLHQGFFQVGLAPDTQRYYNIATDAGIYTSTRLLQGSRNATAHFTRAVNETLGDLIAEGIVVVYVDDLLILARSQSELVDNLIRVLTRLHEWGWKASAKKIVCYTDRVQFCGHVFSATGVSYNPDFVAAFTRLPVPTNAGDLMRWLASCNWLRASVSRYAEIAAPLQDILNKALAGLPRRTAARAQRVLLSDHGWSDVHVAAFRKLTHAVAHACELSYPLPDHHLCVFTDASKDHYAGVVTQVPHTADHLPIMDRPHLPVAFVSGSFTGATLRYSILELEALSLVRCFEKCHQFLHRPDPILVFVDNRNVVALFSQDASVLATRRHSSDRVSRWQTYLRGYSYRLTHLPGTQNVCADMISRYVPVPPTEPGPEPARVTSTAFAVRRSPRLHASSASPAPVANPLASPHVAPVVPPAPQVVPPVVSPGVDPAPVAPLAVVPRDDPPSSFDRADFLTFTVEDLPSETQLQYAQQECIRADVLDVHALGLHRDSTGLWVTPSNQVFVPAYAFLRLRLVVLSHCGPSGHRSIETSYSFLHELFWWPSMRTDVRAFCLQCLHCLRVRGGGIIARPLLRQMQPTAPNTQLHLDYVYMQKHKHSDGHDYDYVLVVACAYSRFVELIPCDTCSAWNVVHALLQWFSRHGVARRLVSDRASHFMAEVVSELTEKLRADWHYVVSYAHHPNGLIERLNRTMLDVLVPLMLDGGIPTGHWPWVLPVVQACLNNSPSTALGGLAPITVFQGRQPTNPVAVVFPPSASSFSTVRPQAPQVVAAVGRLQADLEVFCRIVDETPPRNRKPRSGERPVDFGVGDLVLVSERHGLVHERTKLNPVWTGPCRVTGVVNDLVFKVQSLVDSSEVREVHAQFLKRWSGSDFPITAPFLDFVAHSTRGSVVSDILDHYVDDLQSCLLVAWDSLPADAATWEPLDQIFADVPTLVRRYIKRVVDPDQRRTLEDLIKSL